MNASNGGKCRDLRPSWNCFAAAVIVVLYLLAAGTAEATSVLIRFDEKLPGTPVHGETVNGVTFSFAVGGAPSTDARFDLFGAELNYIQPFMALVGDASGTLQLDFDTPISELGFGVALSTTASLSPGFIVELFSPADVSLELTPMPTVADFVRFPVTALTEGRFDYFGDLGPVSRATIHFNDLSSLDSEFAFDNLTLTPQPVPEPTTLLLLGTGLVGLACRRRLKK